MEGKGISGIPTLSGGGYGWPGNPNGWMTQYLNDYGGWGYTELGGVENGFSSRVFEYEGNTYFGGVEFVNGQAVSMVTNPISQVEPGAYVQTGEYMFWEASSEGTWSTAIGLTIDWALGIGEDKRTFVNDAVANSFRDARVTNQVRDYWYAQVNAGNKTICDGVTNFLGRKAWTGGNFGVKGLIAAGFDPMEQFVGSFTPTISSDGQNLTFTIQNTTSFRSLMYGVAPDWLRSTWRPGGNITQTYIFIEPINFNLIRQ